MGDKYRFNVVTHGSFVMLFNRTHVELRVTNMGEMHKYHAYNLVVRNGAPQPRTLLEKMQPGEVARVGLHGFAVDDCRFRDSALCMDLGKTSKRHSTQGNPPYCRIILPLPTRVFGVRKSGKILADKAGCCDCKDSGLDTFDARLNWVLQYKWDGLDSAPGIIYAGADGASMLLTFSDDRVARLHLHAEPEVQPMECHDKDAMKGHTAEVLDTIDRMFTPELSITFRNDCVANEHVPPDDPDYDCTGVYRFEEASLSEFDVLPDRFGDYGTLIGLIADYKQRRAHVACVPPASEADESEGHRLDGAELADISRRIELVFGVRLTVDEVFDKPPRNCTTIGVTGT